MIGSENPAAPGDAAGFGDAHSWQAAHPENSQSRSENQSAPDGGAMIADKLLRAALDLAGVGLRPAPMRAAKKRPALCGWREAASLDPVAIAATFEAARHADGLGVATGGGVFVIDLDRGHAGDADGVATFAGMIARHGAGEPLALGPRVRTPSGGMHLYFASPPGLRIRNRVALIPGVDVRGDGGLAMVPPSARDGVAYRWAPSPWEREIPPASAWLLALVAPPPPPRPVAPARPFTGGVSSYALAALRGELAAVAGAGVGTRNAALFAASARLGSLCAAGMLPADAVAADLARAAAACGLTGEDGAGAVEATIASGLRAGLKRPRSVPVRKGVRR